jgi:hypothetical protein
MSIQTEFPFRLPRGYIDAAGQVHRDGQMRLATALDEIEAIQDPGVQANEAYLPVALLSRVVTRLGSLANGGGPGDGAPVERSDGAVEVTPRVIGGLFASDLAYLEDLYMRLNSAENMVLSTVCPHCGTRFEVQAAPLGLEVTE